MNSPVSSPKDSSPKDVTCYEECVMSMEETAEDVLPLPADEDVLPLPAAEKSSTAALKPNKGSGRVTKKSKKS